MLSTNPVIQALGFALVAFLWQGAVIGAVTVAIAVASRRASTETRYLIGCVALAALALAPVVTVAARLQNEPSIVRREIVSLTSPGSLAMGKGTASGVVQQSSSGAPDARMSIVVVVWSAGVVLLGLQLLRSGMLVARMRRLALPLASREKREMLGRLAERMSVSLGVRLLESTVIDVPAVIGWLRPAIVVPVSALAGLSPAHFEAILAHELAHVRRRDYLVNILQRVIETLLFYHPAVWWVSGWIRREREYCCDDLAAAACGTRVAYAHALRALELSRRNAPALAMGARGGELVQRIRRLVNRRTDPLPNWPGGVAMIVPLVALLTIGSHATSGAAPAVTPPVIVEVPSFPIEALRTTDPVPTTPAIARPSATRQAVSVSAARETRAAQAQAAGSVTGTVIDQLGGVLPGVTVELRSDASSNARTATTNASGRFVIEDVPPGAYELNATLSGFRKNKNATLVSAGQQTAVAIRLQIGMVAEEMTVSGTPGQPPAPITQLPQNLQTALDYRAAAHYYYDREAFADADQMLARELELVRASQPSQPQTFTIREGVVRVGGDIREPRKLYDVRPVYPADELTAGRRAAVNIDAVIAGDGTITDAVVTSAPSGFDAAAIGAVRQWMFSPTLLNGVPVNVSMTVTINFTVQ